MASFATLKTKIVAKVEALSDWFDTDSVYEYEPEIAEGLKDPFAVVIASGNENDFVSTSENRRMYSFVVRIYMERKSRGASKTETDLQSIIDALIDDFDEDYTLDGAALISKAAPSRWGYIIGEKEYRTAEIVIQAKTDFNVNP